MADSVVKLRIDSKEYDANIKRAGDALQQYFNRVREGGGTLEYLDEGVLEAVKAMGEMGTKAESTRGAMRELLQATADMTVQYRGLSDAERATPLGEAMAESISKMTERAGVMRDAMDDVTSSIQHAASDTRGFDQVAGGISLMTSGLQTAVGAANLLGIEMGNQEKVLATLASAMSITNGLQTVQNLLQSQSALMMGVQAAQASMAAAAQTAFAAATGSATAAQTAFNVVANANPYVLLATAIAAVGTALYAYASAADKAEKEAEELAQAEEEARKKAEDSRNAFVNTSAEAMNTASRLSSLQVAYKNANSEIGKTSILKEAQAQFKKLGFECNNLSDAQNLLVKNGSKVIEIIRLQGNVAALSAVRMEAYKNSFKMLMENGYSANAAAILAGYNKEVMELDGQITQMQGRAQGLRDSLPGGGGGNTRTGRTHTGSTHTGSNTPKVEMSEEQKLQKQINELVQQGLKMDEQGRATQREKIAALQEQLKVIKETKDELLGIDNMPVKGKIDEVVVKASPEAQMRGKQKAFGADNLSEKSLSTYISGVKSILSTTDIGSEVYESIKAQLADATGMQEVLQAAMDAGISGVELDGIGTKMKEALLDGDIPEDMFNDVLKMINKLREEAGKEPVKINFETGNLEEVKKDSMGVEDATIAAAQAVNQVAGALQNIEDPGVKAAAIVAEAIANIALGFAQASKAQDTVASGWGWLVWLAAGAAALATTISTVHSLTGFAGGGVVEGNSYSGDNQLVRVNAGETILTRAQSGVIADALEGSPMSNLKLETYVSGRRLRIVMNNDSMARGQGKLVSSNTLRG